MKTNRNRRRMNIWSSLVVTLAIVWFTGPATAGTMSMETNVDDLAGQMERWSKQCGNKPLTPEAQAKLSELLLETSKLLRQIAHNHSSDMQTQYHQKIMEMKTEWDPFDNLYGN